MEELSAFDRVMRHLRGTCKYGCFFSASPNSYGRIFSSVTSMRTKTQILGWWCVIMEPKNLVFKLDCLQLLLNSFFVWTVQFVMQFPGTILVIRRIFGHHVLFILHRRESLCSFFMKTIQWLLLLPLGIHNLLFSKFSLTIRVIVMWFCLFVYIILIYCFRGNYTKHLDKVLEEAAVVFYPHVKFMRVCYIPRLFFHEWYFVFFIIW